MRNQSKLPPWVEHKLQQQRNIEEDQIRRYGPSVRENTGFLRNQRRAYRRIINDMKRSPRPNRRMKAEMSVLRGERRAALRRIYPNPYIRFLRNAVVLPFNLLRTVLVGIAKVIGAIAKTIFQAVRDRNQSYRDVQRHQQRNSMQQGRRSSHRVNQHGQLMSNFQSQQRSTRKPINPPLNVMPLKNQSAGPGGPIQNTQAQQNGVHPASEGEVRRVYSQRPNTFGQNINSGNRMSM